MVSSTPYLTLVLPGAAQFMTLTGEIDTPDNFGKPASGGIEFGGASGTPTAGVEFQSDGTFTDGNGSPINGTIFLGLPNVLTSARAITILGNPEELKFIATREPHGCSEAEENGNGCSHASPESNRLHAD